MLCCGVVLGVQVCSCCVQRLWHIWSEKSGWFFMRLLLPAPHVSCIPQPIQSFRNQACYLLKVLYLTNRFFFFVLLSPHKTLLHFFQPSSAPPSSLFLSHFPFLFPSILFIHSFGSLLLCCPTWPLITPPIGCAPLALQ